jgi:signal transduction histidine kinase
MRVPQQILFVSRSTATGYCAGVLVPVGLTYVATWLNLPLFVFEHLVILIVLTVAIPWGLGPAVLAAIVSVTTDNLLLREPIGRPTITGYRDALDLVLFTAVAVVVSGLVTRAHSARIAAQEAADRERRAREERDRLIATVAHDLATPLQVLHATVQVAQLKGTAEVEWSGLLERLATATARATSLVRMLSDAQALDNNSLGLSVKTCDLRIVVSPIVQMMDRFSEQHPVILTVPDEPVLVDADAPRLQRVLENLVNNAIKYSPNGGAIEVSIGVDGTAAIVRVRDHGIGISPAARPHVFDRSYRAPEASAFAPGLGLGLSIAAQVVAKHGGTIEAVPADDVGTAVIVRLPLASNHVHALDQRGAEQGLPV